MVSATVQQVVDDALTIIGEVAGAGVQTFSEDRMIRDTVRSFNLLFKKYHWPQFRKWQSLTLDGALGIVTTDALQNVLDFEDFIAVCFDKSDRRIPTISKNTNPFALGSGTQIYAWTSLHATDTNYQKRKLQFYPVTATGNVNIAARIYPVVAPNLDWKLSDIMNLDRDMLAWGAAFMTLSSDDLNPSGAATAQSFMEMKYRDIIGSFSDQDIPLTLGRSNIPLSGYREI